MVSVAAFFLMILAFAAIGYPLLRPDVGRALPLDEEGIPEDLHRERDAAYRAIKELETDHRLGHLSTEDFRQLRGQYVDRAARILKRLDASRTAPARSPRTKAPACPACGTRRRPRDRFCGACGRVLRVAS